MPRCMPTQCVIALLVYLILRPAEKTNYNNTNVIINYGTIHQTDLLNKLKDQFGERS